MSYTKNFFSGVKEGMEMFGKNISIIINSVLLSLVYFIGVGITSISAKLFNKKFLEMKIEANKESYWSYLNLTKKPINEYYRQF